MAHQVRDTLSAVVLAAGFSSRMGNLKALLPLGGLPVIERAVGLFRESGIDDIIVVTGFRAGQLSAMLKQTRVQEAFNPDFRSGMFSSVQAGARCIAGSSQGFLLLPVDIPLVRSYTVRLLIEAFRRCPGNVIHPRFDGRRGHPPLIPAALVPGILAWPGTQGLRGCLAASGAAAVDIDVPDRFVLADMDTPEDYQRLLEAGRRRDIPTPAECDIMLQSLFPVSREILRHSRRVAGAAVAMGEALCSAGLALDLDMIHAAAVLHDIAKGRPSHAKVGGDWLTGIGLSRIGAIVASHIDPHPLKAHGVAEKEIIYLADKLVSGERLVCLDERFGNALKCHGHDPAARRRILRRYEAARRIARCIETETGLGLYDLLGAPELARDKVKA